MIFLSGGYLVFVGYIHLWWLKQENCIILTDWMKQYNKYLCFIMFNVVAESDCRRLAMKS